MQKRNSVLKLSLLLCLGLMILMSSTAFAAVISPTQFVPGDTAVSRATGTQLTPAISHANGVSLVVWSDHRAVPTTFGFQEFETAGDIYGMLLDASGNPLSSMPFPIAQGKANQTTPRLSWNGSNWLVLFQTTVLNGTGGYYETALAAVRVSPTGQVLDPEPIRLYNTAPVGAAWTVGSDGTDWIIVHQDDDLVAVRVTADGQLQQPATIIVPRTYYLRFNLELACASGTCLLTFNEADNAGAIRFDSNFNVLGGGLFTLLNGAYVDALAANNTGFYAVWSKSQPDFSTALFGSRIDLNGNLLDGSGDIISGSTFQGVSTGVLGWDGTNWRAAWSLALTSYAARISAAGQVLDPGGVALPGVTLGEIAVTNNGSLQMVRSEFTENNYAVFTSNISPAFVPGAQIALSLGLPAQLLVDTAVGSNGYMMTYRSETANETRILAQPLNANGTPLTSQPIQLASGPVLNGPSAPSVAWNGSNYVITWSVVNTIYAQRLQPNGTLIDTSPIAVMPGFGPADVSAVGSTYLIVGRHYGSTPQIINVFVARLDGTTGAVLDASPKYAGGAYVRSVALTTVGDRWFLAFHSTWSHDDPIGQTAGVFIESDGTVGPSFFVYGYYSTAGGNGIFQVAAAANDTTVFVVQSAELTSGIETDLVGVLVNSDGTTQPPINLTPWQGNQYRPHVAWDGTQFVLTYSEQRNRFAPLTLDMLDARGDLYGMRISATGTKIDPQGFMFSNSPLAETHSNVAAANGVSLLAGSIFQNSQAAYRVGYQQYGVGGNPWPVAVAGANVLEADVPFTVNFTSTGSTDPNGTLVAYAWDFGDGATSTAVNPSHTYTTPGEYVATLTVTDNQGASTSNAVGITAQAPNLNPVAFIAADVTSGPAPLNVAFSAAGSYDPDGSIGNIEWNFGDGNIYYGSPAFNTFYEEGTYNVTVTVFDGRGGSGTASMQIQVGAEPPNQSPTAVAIVDDTSGPAPFNPIFSSASSTDSDGFITDWLWNFGDGTTSNVPHPAIKVYNTPGTYLVTLTVTDNDGATDSDTLTITVTGGGSNQPPTAVIAATPSSGPAPLTVNFNAAGSSDADGSIVSYAWNFGDGRTSTRVNPRIRYNSNGVYTVTLTVIDDDGATGTTSTLITVGSGPVNQPPTAVASANVTSGTAPLSVNFTGSGSSDSDGSIVSYAWVFGDGGSATTANPSHSYTTAGSYVATLTVTDDDGATDTDTITINVTNPGGGCTTNCARVSGIDLVVRNNGTLLGTVAVVNQNGTALTTGVVSATWTLPNGATSSVTAPLTARGTARFTVNDSGAGTYTLTVTNITSGSYTFDAANSVLSNSIAK
jgi:PKD repeat protein